MAKSVRTETVELSEDDVKEAIQRWLLIKYGTGGPEWTVSLTSEKTTEGYGANERDTTHCVVKASRKIT